jgi:hypothetical protein
MIEVPWALRGIIATRIARETSNDHIAPGKPVQTLLRASLTNFNAGRPGPDE